METGPRLKVSSDRLVKPGIEPATPGLQGKRFIHFTTAAPHVVFLIFVKLIREGGWGVQTKLERKPSLAPYRKTQFLAFRWRANDGPTLH